MPLAVLDVAAGGGRMHRVQPVAQCEPQLWQREQLEHQQPASGIQEPNGNRGEPALP